MAYLIFALRLALGGVLVVAGILKAHDGPALSATFVAGYRIVPAALVAPLAIALPYVEILLGGYLAAGLFTRVAASLASAQFALFAAAVGSLVVRHISADCGCFGSRVATPPSWFHVAADLALAAACAAIAWRAPGAFAVDALLGASGGRSTRAEGSRS
ncbi:MAG: hypothetical protein NVS2B3_06540 [Vulcanimicrobiaceae bacterium]